MANLPSAAQCVETPIGHFTLYATDSALLRLLPGAEQSLPSNILTEEAATQLCAYFNGQLRQFDLPLAAAGTPFQKRCWSVLATINYGETRSYAWQAQQMGNSQLARAVGSANGANPLPFFIPCHRIIATNGGLGGYNLGIQNKLWLLNHEASI